MICGHQGAAISMWDIPGEVGCVCSELQHSKAGKIAGCQRGSSYYICYICHSVALYCSHEKKQS